MAHATGKPDEHIRAPIRADISHLGEDDRKVLRLLIKAVDQINPIYLAQMRQDLEETGDVFDRSRGNNFYPPDLTREEFDAYLKVHPEDKEALLSPFTNVERDGDRLRAILYSEVYQEQLDEIAQLLEQAAEFTDHSQFKKFLLGKAHAFRTNGFKQIDKEWVRCVGAPFELIIGPYESYDDSLFSIKRDFEGIVGVVKKEVNQMAQYYQQFAIEFDAYLGKNYGYMPRNTLIPMVVIDEVMASGGALYGFVPMACNLPNDKDIHEQVGSKKTFMRNVMDAKFNLLTLPIAKRVLSSEAVSVLNKDLYFLFVLGHELSHGISIRFGDRKEFLDFGPSFEEAKADVFGILFLFFLADQGIIEQDIAKNAVISRVVDGLRQVRLSLEEAHAVATLVQYNWLLKHGAFRFSGQGFEFNPDCFHSAISTLGDEFYKLSQANDYEVVKQFVDKWGGVPDEIRRMCKSLKGIPIDIDPVFDY
ncbi:hypothetical protein MYX06_00765 [Patescibacteria group bacterium AH-259-L05]|nr:hypothetical protein [Patescibacteria group bacterium AH-259-L05]